MDSRNDDCSALFVTERQEYRRLSNRSIQREFKNIGNRIGINLHPHLMRHSQATALLNNGADLVLVQQILGHEKPDTTQGYCQLSELNVRNGYRKFAS